MRSVRLERDGLEGGDTVSEMQTKSISMSGREMKEIGSYITDAMNQAMQDGHQIDRVIMACAYALGAAIAQRGGVLLLDEPLRRALPPLVAGYDASNKLKQQS